jgi:hypothetical protein
MSSENEPEPRKLTVAELLAQNGAGQATEGVTGRRRRGEDAAEETAPQAIIDRVRGARPDAAPAGEPDADGAAPGPATSGPAGSAGPGEPAGPHGDTAARLQPAGDGELGESESHEAADDGGNPEHPSALREWAGLLGVIVGGVLAGAAVWLLFNWLWGRAWVIALVVAVLVVAGAALGVRKLWRIRDAVTEVLAVLAGLIVTVSPAILLALRS